MAPLPVRPRKEIGDERNSFYGFMRWILCIGRYTYLLPVNGLWNKTSEMTRGSLKSWYSVIYVPIVLFQGAKLYYSTYDLILTNNRIEAMDKFVGLIVSTANFAMILYLMRFGLIWNTLVKEIETIETALPPTNNQRTVALIQFLSGMFLVLKILESILNYVFTPKTVDVCRVIPSEKGTKEISIHLTNIDNFYDTFNSFYLLIKSFLTFVGSSFIRLHMGIVYTYSDILIMSLSLYLGCKFKYFNEIMTQKHESGTSRGVASWSTLQVHYTRLSRVVTIIDDGISPLVLLSFFSNLVFILQKTFFIFNKVMKTHLTVTYNKCLQTRYDKEMLYCKSYSCFLVFLRTALICYFASDLHAASRKPLYALHQFPSSAFNADMQRLMSQVYYSDISLTGLKLFRINRAMILGMVGTLLLFELVLFQL